MLNNKQNRKAEAQQHLASRKSKQDRLVEALVRSKAEYAFKLDKIYNDNPTKGRNVAQSIVNQKRAMEGLKSKFGETVISQTYQTRPENVLKIVRIGSANSNRGNIFTEFPLTSTDDAIYYVDMTYESALRGATAGDKIYEKINRFYAGEMYETASAGDGSTQYTITCGTAPIVRNQVRILYDRKYIGYDDGNGTIVPVADEDGNYVLTTSATATYQTVDYTTGAVKLEFDSAPSASNVIVVIAQFDSENSTNYTSLGKVSLTVSKKRFSARPMPLGFTYSLMSGVMFETTGLGDVNDYLIGAVGDELAKSKDYKAIALARSLALTNNSGSAYTFNCNFAQEGEVSDKLHAQKILAKINAIGGIIYNDLKRGKVNKAVCGVNALIYLQKHDLWKDDTSQSRTGVYFAGMLSDIEVYVCPAETNLVATDEILLTFKNDDEGMDVAIAFGTLVELESTLQYPEMYVDGNIASVEDYLPLNTKFIRLLKLENLSV